MQHTEIATLSVFANTPIRYEIEFQKKEIGTVWVSMFVCFIENCFIPNKYWIAYKVSISAGNGSFEALKKRPIFPINGILLPKLFWPRIFNFFEITRTIYSNSERSEQFLVKAK